MTQLMVPSLQMGGWETDPAIAADSLFSYYLTTDVDTSIFYKLRSMSATQMNWPNNMNALASEIANDLSAIYNAYFDSAQVTVVPTANAPVLSGSSAIYRMNISANLTKNGVEYTLSELIGSVNGKFMKLQGYNGTGL